MRRFEEFLATDDVKRVSPDYGLARSLKADAEERFELMLSLKLDEKSATLIFEQAYDALRQCSDALLAIKGYRSYSHVATLSFLLRYSCISSNDVRDFDNAREKRNLSIYYAKKLNPSETREMIALYRHLKPKLDALFRNLTP